MGPRAMTIRKTLLHFFILVFCFFAGSGLANAKLIAFADELNEYLGIFQQLYSSDDLKVKIEVIYPRIIKNYKAFIKKYPKSHLVDDAKLRIAEFYKLSRATRGEEELFPGIKFDKNSRKKANHWLKDIVVNHPNGKISDPTSREDLNEPTAAFALYYLYAWNGGDKRYLKELIKKYPNSKLIRGMYVMPRE